MPRSVATNAGRSGTVSHPLYFIVDIDTRDVQTMSYKVIYVCIIYIGI